MGRQPAPSWRARGDVTVPPDEAVCWGTISWGICRSQRPRLRNGNFPLAPEARTAGVPKRAEGDDDVQEASGGSAAAARWSAALSGHEADRARATARDIGHAVLDSTRASLAASGAGPSVPGGTGLAGGPAGVAVLLAELARVDGDGPWADAAGELLDAELDALAQADQLTLGLFTGAAGVAWALARL